MFCSLLFACSYRTEKIIVEVKILDLYLIVTQNILFWLLWQSKKQYMCKHYTSSSQRGNSPVGSDLSQNPIIQSQHDAHLCHKTFSQHLNKISFSSQQKSRICKGGASWLLCHHAWSFKRNLKSCFAIQAIHQQIIYVLKCIFINNDMRLLTDKKVLTSSI